MKYLGAGVTLVAPIIAGALIGQWLDRKQDSSWPMWTVILCSVAIIVGLYGFLKPFMKSK